MKRLRLPLCFILALVFFASPRLQAQGKEFFLYSGTYTGFKFVRHNLPQLAGQPKSKGIYVMRFNAGTGEIGEPQLAAEIANPSFITISPNHKFLYAVSEDPTSVGPPLDHASYVSAYAIEPATGKLRLLNTKPTGGTSTCFLSMDQTGRYVMMANFGSGSVTILNIHPDGSIGGMTAFMQHIGHSVDPLIQAMPHPHSILPSPDNRHVIVSDLGQDKVFVYDFDDKTGALSPPEPHFATVAPGGGPRHFTFGRNGKFGYQLGEMSGALNVFAWDPAGVLTPVQAISTVTPGLVTDNHSAEIEVGRDGRFLYESNRRVGSDGSRGPDTIGVFAIDPVKGTLTQVQEQQTIIMPRSFAIDPTGSFLLAASELHNTIVSYKIDQSTGKLAPTGKQISMDTPVCLKFVPVQP
ncbi:lactonase family protein [Granulicella sp. WH15]|uniref:lactonase family protein n=1 Tax=Granulicella sp. WH15 TaxID=2602070 RepID=UPI0013A5B7CD|nr:lactonase family protein [Granulicella sp. WH15]